METTEQERKKLTRDDLYARIFSVKGTEEKRDLLKQLSESAKMMMELRPDIGDGVNDVILNTMYKNEVHTEFDTFKGWKEKGHIVKKGSKAFFIWSKPRRVQKKRENEDGEKDEYKMYGIAHLFSNVQVEPITIK